MTIGGNYPTPVLVNGYSCINCTQVAEAKKGIDPAHPKSGPYGIDAKDDPTTKTSPSFAVTFGGSLTGPASQSASQATSGAAADTPAAQTPAAPGAQVDISA